MCHFILLPLVLPVFSNKMMMMIIIIVVSRQVAA